MKPTKSLSLACGLSLLILPVASAGNADKKFDKFDTDGDGKISRVEYSSGAERMFAEMDANSDSILTAAELDAKKADKYDDKDRQEMSAAEKISVIDENNDGRVTAAEHASRSDNLFSKMDSNNDGALSRQELQSGHKKMMKEKRDS